MDYLGGMDDNYYKNMYCELIWLDSKLKYAVTLLFFSTLVLETN